MHAVRHHAVAAGRKILFRSFSRWSKRVILITYSDKLILSTIALVDMIVILVNRLPVSVIILAQARLHGAIEANKARVFCEVIMSRLKQGSDLDYQPESGTVPSGGSTWLMGCSR
jgi:hypothetical protein